MAIIYILENKINNKYYVGQTIRDVDIRLDEHIRSKSFIGKALKKYGIENFNKIILENIPIEKLNELEQKYIKEYNSLFPGGYNFDTGGNLTRNLSEETKKKLSESRKGKIPWNKGLTSIYSKETLEKMSEAHKNISEETRKKMSVSHKNGKETSLFAIGNKVWLGRHHTEESKEKNRQASLGNKNFLGRHHTKETKRKMSNSQKGKVFTEEHCRHISEARKVKIKQ